FVSEGYPYVDLASGGSVDGVVRAAERILSVAKDDTRIIPGHGKVTNRARVKAWHTMLVTIRDRIRALVTQGKSLAEVQATKPTAEFDAEWGGAFISGPQLVETVYKDLSRRR